MSSLVTITCSHLVFYVFRDLENYMKLNGVVNEIKLMFFYHFSMCQFIVSPHVFCKESRREAPKEPGCI